MKLDEHRQKIALHRYKLILPVISNDFIDKSAEAYFKRIAEITKFDAFNNETHYCSGTIKSWYIKYRKNGFDGLIPKQRNDKGYNRTITTEAANRIKELKTQYRRIPCTVIIDKLVEEGTINRTDFSLRSIQRLVKQLDFNVKVETKQRLKYEMSHINECWQADTTYLPHIKVNGVSKRLYLMVIIDDYSRLIVGHKVYFEDNTENFFDVTKSAIKKFGYPKKMFVDNGKNYKNTQVELLFARIGSVLIHAAVYSGASKGKVERINRSIKDRWMSHQNFTEFKHIDEVNASLNLFIKTYNHDTKHSAIGNITPFERYQQDLSYIKRIDNDIIDQLFLMEKTCKVYSDSTIKFNNKLYVVPYDLSTEKHVDIKYTPNYKEVYISKNDKLIPIEEINLKANARVTRINLSGDIIIGEVV